METISMNSRERRRLEACGRVKMGEMSMVEASELLKISYRQMKRIFGRYLAEGDGGLMHRGRGRPGNRQPDTGLKAKALKLYEEHFSDFGPTLAAEHLAREFEVVVKIPTLRRWLLQAGLWQRTRKRKDRRQRRPRRRHLGELVQMDGSIHDWFEGRLGGNREHHPTLMVLVDDATGRTYAQFYENESWHSAADVFRQYVEFYGLPRALYVDRHSIYREPREPLPAEILADKTPQTQFGRAMEELDVELILARSAQAKGRVERMNGTLQDRLVKALRRAGINDLESANAFLKKKFLPELNNRFRRAPAESADWHRPLEAGVDLLRILSVQQQRVVNNDWTLSWKNQVLQLTGATADLVAPQDQVTVCQYLDGTLHLFAGEQELQWSPSREVESPRAGPRKPRGGPTGSSQGNKPAAKHPWNHPEKRAGGDVK